MRVIADEDQCEVVLRLRHGEPGEHLMVVIATVPVRAAACDRR